MDFEVFDNVKFEKAKAIARYNRFKKLTRAIQFVEVLVAFALISWSTKHIPGAVRISCKYLFEFSTYLFNHHVIFLIGNAIIILLVVLCRQSDDGSGENSGDLYDDYVKHSEAHQRLSSASTTSDSSGRISPAAEKSGGAGGRKPEEKQVVCCDNALIDKHCCDDVETAIKKATGQIKRFERTQSEMLRRELSAARPRRRELRRSETEISRSSEKSGDRRLTMLTPFKAGDVERLSNEDFQLAMDAYIKKHMDFFLEQKLADEINSK